MLKVKIELLEIENKYLLTSMEKMDKHTRKNNVILSGIPMEKEESLREVVKNIGNAVNDVCAVHRLSSKAPTMRFWYNLIIEILKMS